MIGTTTIRPRHTHIRNAAEHRQIAARYKPSARELFPILRDRLLASRPVIGERKTVIGRDSAGRRKFRRTPIYGTPTFRNALVEGEHL